MSKLSIHCQNCSFSHLCIPVSLSNEEIQSLDDIIERKKPIQRGQLLFSLGTPLTSLYAVRSGSFKSYITAADGAHQIIGFHLPGDIIGFNAVGKGMHQSYTEALETSLVCEIPYDTLDDMSAKLPGLRRQVVNLMSNEIQQDQQSLMLINKRNAQERIAHFLLTLSARFQSRGLSPSAFNLTMTRGEIGNFLGLTVETVSRILSQFNRNNLIQVEGKLIEIKDMDGLREQLSDNLSITQHCR